MSLQELFTKVMEDDALKAKLAESAKNDKLVEFAKENGVEATKEEIEAFISEKANGDEKLSLDDLENAAGGDCGTFGLIDCKSSHRSACGAC